jgi:hypothetical protein
VFETPTPPGSALLARVAEAPRPFVIEPPAERALAAGQTAGFHVVLVGRAIEYAPLFAYAFQRLGQAGVGPGRGRYRLERAETAHLVLDSCPARSVTVRFVSPAKLRYEGRVSDPAAFHVFFRNLLRRVNLLNAFHCDGGLMPPAQAAALIEAAAGVETAAARWEHHQWERHSARQDRRVPMEGFTGEVTWRGDLAPFWPWLRAGEWVHVGKNATFGLGRYVITAVL